MSENKRWQIGLWLLAFSVGWPSVAASQNDFPLDAKRILFVGDSITHAGVYVSWIETQLRLQHVSPLPEIVNIGLGSETCSGLSEPDHPFPRPDVHERLDRALEKIKPDVVVACYGMNDGIYYPFSQERFEAYQKGVERLIEKCRKQDAKVILLTPTPFDPLPLQESGRLKPLGEEKYAYFAMYEDYDEVLRRYSQWILEKPAGATMVIDLHGPFSEYLAKRRGESKAFTLTPDGIHPNAEGHRLIGNAILKAWGIAPLEDPKLELIELVHRRSTLLHDAWLSEVGHKRPGVKPGLPLAEAQQQAAMLEQQINELID